MNTPLAAIITLAAGLTVPLLVPTHSVAAPLPSTPLPQKATLVQTKHADVDGDGHSDTVRIYNAGKKGEQVIWKVKVTTATGKTDSVTYTNPGFGTEPPWYGWAKLDGHHGAEVLLDGETDDFQTLAVLTWRSGTLKIEKSAADPGFATRSKFWSAATESSPSGYRFYTSNGHRYVKSWSALCPDSGTGNCTVKTKRSIWRNGDWHVSGSVTTTKVAISKVWARAQFAGLTVHK